VRLELEANLQDADYFNFSAADTAMERPSRDLMSEDFHDVLVGGVTGTDTLMSLDKAHRLLGYTPDFT
jgi:hypothetical protein